MNKLILFLSLGCLTLIYSQTDLSGTLTADLTLTAAESPYQLSDHLIVGESITLTIEAGATIDAAGTQQILIQGGAVVSEGTSEAPIVLKSVSGASIALKKTNLDLSSFKFTQFNGFHLFVAAGETDNEENKCSGTLVLHNIKFNNNNVSDGSRSGNTTIDIQDTTFENVTLSRSHRNNFIIIEDSKINNSNINVSDFRINRNSFYRSTFESSDAYDFRESNDDKITFNKNNFYDSTFRVYRQYDQLIFNRSKFVNTQIITNGFYRDTSANNLTITNSIIVQNDVNDSNFLFQIEHRSRIYLYSVSIYSDNNNIVNVQNGYKTSLDFDNSTIESVGLPNSGNYFNLSHPNEDNSWASAISNSNLFLKETPANRFLIYNKMRSGFDASSNYWGDIDTEKLPRLVYDFNDNPTASLGAVDLTTPLEAPNTSAPISSPKGFIKLVDGDDLILKWVPNIESDVAGYKIHYGSHTDYVYENTVDVENVTTYTLTGGAALENINITAYDTNADGVDDQLEGYESWYTEVKDQPTLAFETVSSSIEENENASVQLKLNYASPEDVVVNLTYAGTAVSGTDYTAPETLTIPIGQTTANLAIEILDDTDIEILEDIQVTIASANGVTLGDSITHTVSLISDDYPSLTISPDLTEFSEGDVQEFTVELSEAHSKSTILKIDFSGDMSPNDYVFTKELDEEYDFVTFSKTWEDSENDEAFQDRINDYVWLTRSDCVYDSDHPVMFTPLEDIGNKILCDHTRVSEAGYFTTQDWFYAGRTELFNNLKLFADNFENYFDNNIENAEWFNEILEADGLRNSHIWQGLIANDLGENLFVETAQKWKLIHDE